MPEKRSVGSTFTITMTNAERKVVVLNQHGDNRGDEAAMRAMLEGLADRLGPVSFTVFHQFQDPEHSCVTTEQRVDYLPLRVPPLVALRLGIWAVLARVGLRLDGIAGPTGRRALERYDEADLVVSAPGGPYFGDIYADHEIVHWFYVWMAVILKKPLALYAPSCGPFEHRILNVVRRRGFRWFDRIVVREARSAAFLSDLTAGAIQPEVTADSAFQSHVPARPDLLDRDDAEADRFHVVVAVREPTGGERDRHDAAVCAAIDEIAGRRNARFYFLPQLHGQGHQDRPYLERLRSLAGPDIDAVVLPDSLDSAAQRGLVAASDLVVAGRYHPGVFAVSAHVPAFIIPYEHKARGMAEAAEVDEWAIDLSDLTAAGARTVVADLLGRLDEVSTRLARTEPAMSQRAARSSDVVAELVQH